MVPRVQTPVRPKRTPPKGKKLPSIILTNILTRGVRVPINEWWVGSTIQSKTESVCTAGDNANGTAAMPP
jgi:hypothetical protein